MSQRTGFRMLFKAMWVLVSFPVALIKSSDKGNLRREGFILAHCSRVHHGREVRWQDLEIASHMTPTGRNTKQ